MHLKINEPRTKLSREFLDIVLEAIDVPSIYPEGVSNDCEERLRDAKKYIEAVVGLRTYIPSDGYAAYKEYEESGELWRGRGKGHDRLHFKRRRSYPNEPLLYIPYFVDVENGEWVICLLDSYWYQVEDNGICELFGIADDKED